MNYYHRLQRLENAVINYGGGIYELSERVIGLRIFLNEADPVILGVLKDVSGYLEGIMGILKIEEVE